MDQLPGVTAGAATWCVANAGRQTTTLAWRSEHGGAVWHHGPSNNTGVDWWIDRASYQWLSIGFRPWTTTYQSAISESPRLESKAELLQGHRPPCHEDRLRVSDDPHSSAGHQSLVWPRHVQRVVLSADLRSSRPSIRLRDCE